MVGIGIKNYHIVIEYNDNNYVIKDWNIIDLRYDNEKNSRKQRKDKKKLIKEKNVQKISLKDLSRNLYKKLKKIILFKF